MGVPPRSTLGAILGIPFSAQGTLGGWHRASPRLPA